MRRIILMRHGDTEGNIFCGSTDLSLSFLGAEKIKKKVLTFNEKIDSIYTSPLKRAYETAKLFKMRNDVPIYEEKLLREVDYGIFEGKRWSEIEVQYPEIAKRYIKNNGRIDLPNGEKVEDVKNRAYMLKNKILNEMEDNKTFLFVTHSNFMVIFLEILLNVEFNGKIIVPNGGVFFVDEIDGEFFLSSEKIKSRNERFLLVLGGARSGKSSFAESVLKNYDNVTYIATAINFDDEMDKRISLHRKSRPSHWQTIEEPYDISKRLNEISTKSKAVLIDCITVYSSNLFLKGESEEKIKENIDAIFRNMPDNIEKVVMVSNEVGLGIVPVNRMAREYRDLAGRLNRFLAQKCDTVYMVEAGIPRILK